LQQSENLLFGLAFAIPYRQPVRTFGNEESSQQDQSRWNDCRGVHPAPGLQARVCAEDKIAHGCSDERPGGLKAKGCENQGAASSRGRAFGDDQVGRRVVTPEREPHSEKADDQPHEVLRKYDSDQEQNKQHHFDDEHRLAAESIGEAAQCTRSDQNAEQAGGADEAMLCRGQVEFAADQGQCNAGHKYDQPLEELAGNSQPPNSFLHAGHRRCRRNRSIRP
jgi:hypothetical protein